MGLQIHNERCTACGLCEFACSFRRDEACTPLSSSIIVYRGEEKVNYYGVMLKLENSIALARPEGMEEQRIGESSGEEEDEGAAAAKPILLRKSCDTCDGEYFCVQVCPTGALEKED